MQGSKIILWFILGGIFLVNLVCLLLPHDKDKSPILQQLESNMIFVKGGTFTMGCTYEQGTDCEDDEKPPQKVVLMDYYINKFEVTLEEWKTIMGINLDKSQQIECDHCPVTNISWFDIQNFINKLDDLTGIQYRLPTEAEWEYAARGGNLSRNFKYCGSNNLNEVAWFSINSKERVQKVGQKFSNELGLYDMSGNVWEWCSDWYNEHNVDGTLFDPRGPSKGKYKIMRGGSWDNGDRSCRTTNSSGFEPDFKDISLGFRLSRSVEY
jgi:formylglycine-generating enzyme required for sulfatase activity